MGLLLQALAMYHVNLSRIIMYAWDGTNLGSAAEFIKFQMSWHQFERQRVAEIGNRKDSDQKRENNNMPRRFPKYAPAPQVAAQGAAPRGTADNYN
jgi:hypothetical protein